MMKLRAVNGAGLLEALLLVTLACLLWACTAEDEQVAEGGIGGTGITAGPINGFGSVIVNGIRFDVDNARIYKGLDNVAEEVLRPGMVVVVVGDVNEDGVSGSASEIYFDFDLVAYVDELAPDNSWLIAGGQTVLLDELTVIDGEPLQIEAGVYVSSIKAGEGDRLASYVSVAGVGEPIDPLSWWASLGPEGYIGAVLEASGTDNFGSTESDAGLETVDATAGVSLDWSVSLSGVIAQVDSGERFTLQGMTILITDSTNLVDGSVANVVVNTPVLVTGEADADGVVYADEISFQPSDSIPLQGEVEVISGSVVTLAGVDVTVQNTTLMLDSSSAAVRRFSVSDLAVGDKLKVYAYQSAEGLMLTRLERVDSY